MAAVRLGTTGLGRCYSEKVWELFPEFLQCRGEKTLKERYWREINKSVRHLGVAKGAQISEMWNSVAVTEKVVLTACMRVSSPLAAVQTTVPLEIQRWLGFIAFLDFESLGHLWVTRAPMVQL